MYNTISVVRFGLTLAQVLCMVSQLLQVSMCNCPAVPIRHCFLVDTHYFILFLSLLPQRSLKHCWEGSGYVFHLGLNILWSYSLLCPVVGLCIDYLLKTEASLGRYLNLWGIRIYQ